MLAFGADCIIAMDGDEHVDLTDEGSAEFSKMNQKDMNNFENYQKQMHISKQFPYMFLDPIWGTFKRRFYS